MKEENSTSPKDFEEILILTHRIGPMEEQFSMRGVMDFEQIFAPYCSDFCLHTVSIFHSIAYVLDFLFHMGVQIKNGMFYTIVNLP